MNRLSSGFFQLTARALALICLVASSGIAADGGSTVIAIGKQAVSGSNVARAREQAITNALSNAVQQGIISRMERAEISSSLPLLFDVLTGDPHDHVITFKVLGEKQQSNLVVTAVEATLDSNTISSLFSRYQIHKPGGDLPTLLVFISEQVPGDILPRYWWGKNPLPYQSHANQAFTRALPQDRFAIIARPSSDQLSEAGIHFEYIHDTDTALRAAAGMDADIMIMAKARAEEASNVMGQEKAYRSTLSLEAFDVVSGERITSLSTDAVVKSELPETGVKESLTRVGTAAAQTLVHRLNTEWAGGSSSPRAIETRIEGEDYLSSFIMLRKVLSTMSGIQEIQTRELSTDNAIVEIHYQGNGKKLADALLLQSFDAFNLDLSDISDTTLTIRFIPKDGENPLDSQDIEGALISE